MSSITSANAVILLSVLRVFPVPQQIQGFGPDELFGTEPLEVGEVQMGVDGRLSAGFVFNAVKQSFTLQADSPSNSFFDSWYAAEQVAKDKFPAIGIINLIGVNTKWALTRGFLTTFQPLPDAGKVLKVRKHTVTWERVSPAIATQ